MKLLLLAWCMVCHGAGRRAEDEDGGGGGRCRFISFKLKLYVYPQSLSSWILRCMNLLRTRREARHETRDRGRGLCFASPWPCSDGAWCPCVLAHSTPQPQTRTTTFLRLVEVEVEVEDETPPCTSLTGPPCSGRDGTGGGGGAAESQYATTEESTTVPSWAGEVHSPPGKPLPLGAGWPTTAAVAVG